MADSPAFLFPAVPDLFFGSYKKPNAAGSQMGGQNSADARHQYRHTGITLSHFSVKIFGIFFRAFMGNADSFKLSVRRRNFKHCVKHLLRVRHLAATTSLPSLSKVITGRMPKRLPSSAPTAPMRPPFCKYSSVFTEKQVSVRAMAPLINASSSSIPALHRPFFKISSASALMGVAAVRLSKCGYRHREFPALPAALPCRRYGKFRLKRCLQKYL